MGGPPVVDHSDGAGVDGQMWLRLVDVMVGRQRPRVWKDEWRWACCLPGHPCTPTPTAHPQQLSPRTSHTHYPRLHGFTAFAERCWWLGLLFACGLSFSLDST